ncbi:MAG: DHH family phosphoesterase [Thermoproteus sp.]|jgi:nanoRNase/pAp phosphatase (c-di-AMP/oligoRNAs hydrolase)
MYLERLLNVLGNRRRIAVVTHRHADLDALGCALVLRDVLEGLGREAVVVCPDGVAKDADPYARCSEEVPPDIEMAVLADVASLAQVPPMDVPLAIFDHHAVGDELPGVREERPSCSEMALELAIEAGVRPKRDSLIAAALGIYADTARLLRADKRTLAAISFAISEIGPLEKYIVQQGEERSLKMAKLKALARLAIYETRLGVICATHVDAYESDVAALLTSAGCDVAIVASRHGGEVRLVYRSHKVDVGEMAARIGELLGGSGGGHRGASVTTVKMRATKADLPRLLGDVVRALDPDARPLS